MTENNKIHFGNVTENLKYRSSLDLTTIIAVLVVSDWTVEKTIYYLPKLLLSKDQNEQ